MTKEDTAQAMEPKYGEIKILTYYGKDWKEIWRCNNKGEKIELLFETDDREKDYSDVKEMDIVEEMPWSEFCNKYRNSKYAI